MPSLLRLTSEAMQSESHTEEDETYSDYSGYVVALNGHKKYFCLFKPIFTGEDPNDSSFETSSDRRRKSRSSSRSSSRSRSRSHSREDGAIPKKGSGRATSIEVHHKLDRLGLWMERLMEGTLPRLWVAAWPSLDETTNNSSTGSWDQGQKHTNSNGYTLWSCLLILFFQNMQNAVAVFKWLIKKSFAWVGYHIELLQHVEGMSCFIWLCRAVATEKWSPCPCGFLPATSRTIFTK